MRIFSLLAALCLGVTLSAQVKTPEAPAQRSCAAYEKHVQMMGVDAAYAKHHSDIEQQTAAFVQARQEARANGVGGWAPLSGGRRAATAAPARLG